ncbi:hypothetical protein LAZ67_2006623 [Cordylochernes scorpioides]|uniref:Transposase n=1 Tax=Cordylochernes scorpioides TaxID=51811 RepID=A0ABY6K5H8_9ARAC|nr:hypothetical protein LAZ67_2006623 [Cordylochernes scorpioides]
MEMLTKIFCGCIKPRKPKRRMLELDSFDGEIGMELWKKEGIQIITSPNPHRAGHICYVANIVPLKKHIKRMHNILPVEHEGNQPKEPKVLKLWEDKKTLALINEAYEDVILSQTQVYFWFKRFKDGRQSIADDSRSGRPLTSTRDRNIGQVRDSIVADGKSNIDNISEILGISYGSCQNTLRDIENGTPRNSGQKIMQISG